MMELFLFAVSGFNMVYYVILVIFTDAAWMTQIYWPVSAVVFTLLGLILKADRKRKQEHRRCMSLELRTVICTSCGLYFLMVGFALSRVPFVVITATIPPGLTLSSALATK